MNMAALWSSPYAAQGTGMQPYQQQQFGQPTLWGGYGQVGTQPFQQTLQLLQVLPQQLQQIQTLQQQQLAYIQQLLQLVPAQLQQLQQLIQVMPHQITQLQQLQPFGPPISGPLGLGSASQIFGQAPGQVM
jgi:hypothetical protein